jgi:hypothetical protein
MAKHAIDPELKEWATKRQGEYIDAVNAHGGKRAAARALGVDMACVVRGIAAVEKRAAAAGYAPGHFEDGVAPGYRMGKVTVQRGPGGEVERTWERQSPDADAMREAMEEAAAAMAADLPRALPVPAPTKTGCAAHALCNLFTITDAHVGMLAWQREGGDSWDLKIAEQTLVDCFAHMIQAAPRARVAVVNQLGDLMHFDGLDAVTPSHGHLLDADGRFSKVVGVAIRILRRVIDMALATHDEVHVVMAEGNHDLASSVWLRHMFAALYENEPRLTVNDSELPYYVYQHGSVMLGFHHGHKKKNEGLPQHFATQYARVWGDTTHRYAHVGHRHHVEEKEHSGMKVIQHSTLAARDAYAARGGWHTMRQAIAITYHERHGEVARATVTPGMLQ